MSVSELSIMDTISSINIVVWSLENTTFSDLTCGEESCKNIYCWKLVKDHWQPERWPHGLKGDIHNNSSL